jgi:hypothetical protein
MARFKSDSMAWYDQLESLRTQPSNVADAEPQDAIKFSKSHISELKALGSFFDPAAVEKIRMAAKADPSFILSFRNARTLAGLKKTKTTDLNGSIHAALDITITHRLKNKKIEALVKWMAAGNSAESFNPKSKTVRLPSVAQGAAGSATQTLGQRIGSSIDKLIGLFLGWQGHTDPAGATNTPGHGSAKSLTAKEKKKAVKLIEKLGKKLAKFPLKEFCKAEHQICKKLAHAIVSSRASSHSTSSRRSGHSSRSHNSGSFRKGFITLFLTPLHGVVYVLLQCGFLWMAANVFVFPFVPALRPLLEWPFRFAAHLALYDFPAWVWACAHSYLGPTLVIGGLLAVGLVFAWKAEPLRISLLGAALAYLIIHGRGWALESAPWNKPVAGKTTEASVPAQAPQTPLSLGLGQPKRVSRPVVETQVYKPAVSFIPNPSSAQTLYNPKILEQEIAAIPANSLIKDYVFQPDEGMPADLAVSRLQDLTDEDKYTMMIGSGKQKILSVTPSNTNFIITYKSTDPFGLFGNSSAIMNIFLEDVLYIHTDEIDVEGKTPSVIYQCTVVAKGAKNPLTIQCASTDDLENLVSTLEYFIRHSRLAHDAQPAGMPYPTQGVRLSNDCVVVKLWANSPADKAGLGLGEMIWSVDTNAYYPPDLKKLEASFAGLTPGAHNLFVASRSDWDKAQGDVAFHRASSLNPRRRKVSLQL